MLAIAVCAAVDAQAQAAPGTRPRTLAEDLQLFSQVLNQVRLNHADSTDQHKLMMAAVTGLLQAADPHSYVIPAVRLVPDRERLLESGKLAPVPVSFLVIGGSPVVSSVAPGSSAAEVDIQRGDVLLAVDGAAVAVASADELDIALSGPKGTHVALRLERERLDGSRVTLERRVRRERVAPESAVRAATLLGDGIGYVRVTTFVGERIAADLDAAMTRLERAGMRRLVLDLRDNGGGLVDEAARMAGGFLPSGSVVYTATGRRTDVVDTGVVSRSIFRAQRAFPLAVLVNEGTASAAELFAGAVQDHDRAVIIGRPTFGKSLLMRGFPLTDGSVLMLVVGHLRTPCGRVIQRAYRDISVGEYYRSAGARRATAGRPSCTTTGGRTVYGGGGIYPDVVLDRPQPLPMWAARLVEDDVLTAWAAAWSKQLGGTLGSLDAFAADSGVPAGVHAAFRAFAQGRGATIPDGHEADGHLTPLLREALGAQRWGEEGRYRVAVAVDAEVRAAVRALRGDAAPR
ncbi:MAG: S41 family peptidase [Gemmatimonadaceae bacterium]|nr:S41 family peptidase [Gemmatimonadaceae bacterium]